MWLFRMRNTDYSVSRATFDAVRILYLNLSSITVSKCSLNISQTCDAQMDYICPKYGNLDAFVSNKTYTEN